MSAEIYKMKMLLYEVEKIKKVWKTREFREAKNNFQLDKKCRQCGSTKNLTPHHRISYKTLIFWKLRELAISHLCKEKGVTFTQSAITKTGGFSSSGGYIKVGELKTQIIEHPEFKEKARELAKEEYYSFTNIETLCKRCHFAEEKGMVLCHICKKKYHPQNFMSCYGCREEYERRYAKFEKEMDDLETEWEDEKE